MKREHLDQIIKAYDIRGLVESQITPDFTFALGSAFARFLEGEREPSTVLVGEDMRPSSPTLADAFSDGVTSQGMDVIRIGLASTDQLYFAAGSLNLPGAMFTASHNPAEYNGIKLCRSGAKPVGEESGLLWIKNLIIEGMPISNRPVGSESRRDTLTDYVDFLFSLFDSTAFAKNYHGKTSIKIAIDAGNGMAGHSAPAVMDRINAEIFSLFFELDGTFPNHEANPIDPANLKDLQKLVKSKKADLGLAFDGDADRCFLVDENGNAVNPSALTALIASRELKKNPGSKIIYNLISSRAVKEVIEENGGEAVRSRVGHSYIKKLMEETGAIFGGEHSGHFYFKDFWRADSGMLAALHVIAALLESRKPLSKLLAPYNRYFSSGEINTSVKDQKVAIQRIKDYYLSDSSIKSNPVTSDELDGLTINAEKWWFNVRASNTEPLLRLNAEASSQALMERVRSDVLKLINNG